MGAKILLLDIETRPILAYVWSLYKPMIAANQIKEDLEIMTFAAKWLDDDFIHFASTEYESEESLLNYLWYLLDQADIVVAHNGDRFDQPIINGRMLKYDIPPYSPVKTIDTLKSLRANFRLTQNRLDYVAKFLGTEGKLATGGMQLWIDCLEHRYPEAWKKMVGYNRQDVIELENVYKKIRPWITNHPNLGIYNDKVPTVCPKCGEDHIHFRGYAYTTAGKYRRFQCQECGGWGRLAINEHDKDKRKGLGRNVAK